MLPDCRTHIYSCPSRRLAPSVKFSCENVFTGFLEVSDVFGKFSTVATRFDFNIEDFGVNPYAPPGGHTNDPKKTKWLE